MLDLQWYPNFCLIKYELDIHVSVSLNCLFSFAVPLQNWPDLCISCVKQSSGEIIEIRVFSQSRWQNPHLKFFIIKFVYLSINLSFCLFIDLLVDLFVYTIYLFIYIFIYLHTMSLFMSAFNCLFIVLLSVFLYLLYI